jgi:hypothetical protein
MKKAIQKFDASQPHIEAILHMIGQAEVVYRDSATIADVAAWMKVCKRTAAKYLKVLEASGEIIMSKEKYRKNVDRYRVQLSEQNRNIYDCGDYLRAYEIYAQRILGIILVDNFDG